MASRKEAKPNNAFQILFEEKINQRKAEIEREYEGRFDKKIFNHEINIFVKSLWLEIKSLAKSIEAEYPEAFNDNYFNRKWTGKYKSFRAMLRSYPMMPAVFNIIRQNYILDLKDSPQDSGKVLNRKKILREWIAIKEIHGENARGDEYSNQIIFAEITNESLAAMAKEFGCTERSIQRVIMKLAEIGFFQYPIKATKNHGTIYRIGEVGAYGIPRYYISEKRWKQYLKRVKQDQTKYFV